MRTCMRACIQTQVDTSAFVSSPLLIARSHQENAAERQELSEVTQVQSFEFVF